MTNPLLLFETLICVSLDLLQSPRPCTDVLNKCKHRKKVFLKKKKVLLGGPGFSIWCNIKTWMNFLVNPIYSPLPLLPPHISCNNPNHPWERWKCYLAKNNNKVTSTSRKCLLVLPPSIINNFQSKDPPSGSKFKWLVTTERREKRDRGVSESLRSSASTSINIDREQKAIKALYD